MAPWPAAQWLASIAQAVHYAHTQGVVHRDLKPGNVLLVRKSSNSMSAAVNEDHDGRDLEPLVTDFGLAKLTEIDSTQTRTGSVLGTPAYMAPEQAAGRLDKVGPATDVYALGAILYELLTGRPPFLGQSDLETLRQIHEEEPLSPQRLQPSVPRDLETICLACLEKEPSRRYSTAEALADDLERFLAHRPIRVRPPTLVRQVRLWIRRHPARAVIAAVLMIVGFGLPSILLSHTWQLEREHGQAVAAQAAAEESARMAIESEARVRQHVYVADIRVAQQLRQDGDLASLGRLLDRYEMPADSNSIAKTPESIDLVRGPGAAGRAATKAKTDMPFEWRYLERCRDACRLSIDAHKGPVDLVAFNAEGKILATSGNLDGQLRLWDIPSGHPLASFPVRTTPPRRWEEEIAAFSQDGRCVATLVDAGTVVVWDVSTQAELARFEHSYTVLTLAFSPDGAQLAAGGDKQTVLWSCNTQKQVSTHSAARPACHLPRWQADGHRRSAPGHQSGPPMQSDGDCH